jgi:hypothetical protein
MALNQYRQQKSNPKPEVCNVYVAMKSVPPAWESIPGLHNRFINTGSVYSCLSVFGFRTGPFLGSHEVLLRRSPVVQPVLPLPQRPSTRNQNSR